MTERGYGESVVVDVRHLRNDEIVVCPVCSSGNRWAQFVVSYRLPDAEPKSPSRQLFLCRAHLQGFLKLADGVGVG